MRRLGKGRKNRVGMERENLLTLLSTVWEHLIIN